MDTNNSPLDPQVDETPRRRRLPVRLGLLLLLLLALLAFAPQMVAKTPLRGWLINHYARDIRGSIHVGGASFAWWSKPELRDVELRDEKGQTIASSARVRIDRTLLSLALNHADLGTILVEQPTVNLNCETNDSNLEQALAKYIDAPASTSPTRTALRVDLTQGKLVMHDEDSRRTWTAGEVKGEVVVPPNRQQPIRLECEGQVVESGPIGRLQMNLEYRTGRPSGPASAPQFRGEFHADHCAAGPIGVIMRRFEPGLRFEGQLQGDLAIIWNDENPDAPILQLVGNVAGQNFGLHDARLGRDQVKLASLELPCNLSVQGAKIVAEKTRLKCDLGEVSLSGSLDLSQDPFAMLRQAGIEIRGDLDLAGVTKMLPNTLRLQKGTRINSGRLVLNLKSASQADGVVWTGNASAMNLRGEHEGQAIAWENPIAVEFAARQEAAALPRIDKFKVTSEFGRLEASGNEEKLTIDGNLDLGLLANKVGQFVDLSGAQAAGKASGSLIVERDSKNRLTMNGHGRVNDLALTVNGTTIREPNAEIHVDGAGQVSDSIYRVNNGAMHVALGDERIDLELLEAIPNLRTMQTGYCRLALHGDLNRWRGWVGHFAELPAAWQVGGNADASARIRLTAKVLEADSLVTTVKALRFKGAALNIDEPQIALEPTSLKWDRDAGRIEVSDAKLSSQTLVVKLANLTAELGLDKSWMVAGRGSVEGQVGRLQRWLPSITTEPLAGSFDGPFQIETKLGRVGGNAELNIRSLVVGDPAKPTWTEPVVRLAMKGQFDSGGEQVRVEEASLQSQALNATAIGRVENLNSTCDLTLNGQLQYDLERWEPQFRNLLGQETRVAGRDHKPFRIEGSLVSNKARLSIGPTSATRNPLGALKGEAGFSWQLMQAFGAQIGPADVKLRAFGDGWIRIQAIETSFNQGKLKLEPYIRLDPGPTIMAFGKATGIERAKITPAVCSALLGYVMPALGGAREADGEVSLIVEGGQIPFSDPSKADIWGKFVLHHARVGSGPLLQELSVFLKSPPVLKIPQEHVVPFRLVNGRVYHQNLDIPLGEITIRSTGSVGLDGSLALMTEMPVPPKWLGKTQLPKSAQTIKLPIGGTINNPRIDEKALREVIARTAKDAAGESIKQELEKSLQKLLRPK